MHRPHRSSTGRRAAGLLAVLALAATAACGGGDDSGDAADDAGADSTPAPTDTNTDVDTDTDTDTDAPESTEIETDTDTDTVGDTGDPADDDGGGTFEPGPVAFRVVNALDAPVDLYVRTTGLVEAFAVDPGVVPGAVTELHSPPVGGRFVVTTAGAGDATCVTGCDHFIAELSTFPEEGPVRTVVLHESDDGPRGFDLWEHPDESRAGNANAMVPADPSVGLVVVTAIALTDADFGLRLAFEGGAGCTEPVNLDNVLVGGNQTPAYALPSPSAAVVLHDNTDGDCADDPVGGPFTVDAAPGERTHLVLTGSPGDMDAIVVPMLAPDGSAPAPTADSATGGDGDASGGASDGERARAVDLLALQVEVELGFPPADARCTAELLVNAIGPDVLLDGDALVDLDSLPAEFDAPAAEALTDAVDVCALDPALLGG